MIKRHENLLLQLLETLYTEYVVTIHDNKLRLLLGADRLRENAWRTIRELWYNVLEENNADQVDFTVIWDDARKQYIFVWADINKQISELC